MSTTITQNVSVIELSSYEDGKKPINVYKYGSEEVEISEFDLDLMDVVNNIDKELLKTSPQEGLSQKITARLQAKYQDVNFRNISGRLNYFEHRGMISKEELENGWRIWSGNNTTSKVLADHSSMWNSCYSLMDEHYKNEVEAEKQEKKIKKEKKKAERAALKSSNKNS